MITRISTAAAALQSVNQLQRMQIQIAQLNGQISTGLVADPAGQLGARASILYSLHIDSDRQTMLQTNITTAADQLDSMQTTLASIASVTADIAASAMSAADPGSQKFGLVAAAAKGDMAQVLDMLNTPFSTGQAMFSGHDGSHVPMADADQLITATQAIVSAHYNAASPTPSTRLAGTPLSQADIVGWPATTSPAVAAYAGLIGDATTDGASIANLFADNTTFSGTIPASGSTSVSYQFASPAVTSALTGIGLQIKDATGNTALVPLATSPTTGTVPLTWPLTTSGGVPLSGTYTATLVGTDAASQTVTAGSTASGSAGAPSFTGTGFLATNDGQSMQVKTGVSATVTYQVTADQPAFRHLLQGLSMLAMLDPSSASAAQFDDGAKRALVTQAAAVLNQARSELTDAQANLGVAQVRLTNATAIQQSASANTINQIAKMEQSDPATDVVQLKTLQTQLEASSRVTALISQLSFVNFMP